MHIIKLNATDSTNTYLAALVKKSVPQDELIVVTNHQEKGRGQRDAIWQSQPSKSLIFSVFKRIDAMLPQQQFLISMIVSITIANYLQAFMTTAIQIKWPNDIMAGGKKCGGILIENQLRGNAIKSTIIGVGLNINEAHFNNLPHATSLHLVSGKMYDLDSLLKGITSEIFKTLNFLDVNALSEIHQSYEKLLFKKGVLSSFRLPDGTKFLGTINGVDPSGQLKIDLPDGRFIKFWNKEIEMRY